MPVAERTPEGITVRVSPREAHLIKEVPGARYHVKADESGPREHWACHLSWATCVQLRGVFKDTLVIGSELAAWARHERETRIVPSLAWRDLLDAEGDERLRPYQRPAVRFLQTAKRAIIAEEMRVGKMIEAIVALDALKAYPALVICPNSVKYTWEERLREWTDVSVSVVSGSAKQRRDAIARRADVTVINWEAVRLHTRLAAYGSVVRRERCEEHGGSATVARCEVHDRELNAIEWKCVIPDEAHHSANPRAKQTRAVWALTTDPEYVWLLTGTPVLNSPEDLWALGHIVAPEEYPSKTAWIDRYCYTGWNLFGGLEIVGLREDTKSELFAYLDPRFLRRTREVVLPYLPRKTYEIRPVEMHAKQQKAYDAMRDEMLAELEGGVTYVTNALAKLTRLRQFASAAAHLEPVTCPRCKGDAENCARCHGSGVVHRVILEEPSCKADGLSDLVPELGGRQALVMAESKQLVRLMGARLAKEGVELAYVDGDVSVEDRADAIRKFQRHDTQLLLVTLGAGGEGLTLDAADTVVFAQRSFSRVKNLQAEDRFIGEGSKAEVIDLVTRDSVEDRVAEVLREKEELSESIVRDADTYRRLVGG